MSKELENFIDSIATNNHTESNIGFNDIILAKIGDAMDAEKVRLAGSIYNTVEVDED